MKSTWLIPLALAALVLVLPAAPGFAAKHTKQAPAPVTPVTMGSGFLEQCGDKDGDRQLSCLSFVAGLYEGFVTLQNEFVMRKLAGKDEEKVLLTGDKADARAVYLSLTNRYAVFCPPPGGVAYPKLRGLLADFIRTNPKYQDMTTGDLFLAALGKTWPCGGARTPDAPEQEQSSSTSDWLRHAAPDAAPASGPKAPEKK